LDHFWKFIKKTHPIVYQPNKTILTDQYKGSLAAIDGIIPLAGKVHCSFHCQQKHCKKCGGGKGHKPLIAFWMYNLLCSCKSVALLMATKTKYEDQMQPTDHHYLFSIANEMQFQLQGVL
jgi:hypothetical protein